MAPSKSLPSAKLTLVLSYFRTNCLAHTLKDLEKSLPAAAGISSMLVKDYLSALVADNLLSVEKIGSGNWYWSFPADAKRQKERVVADVAKERDKARAVLEACELAVEEERQRLGGGDEGRGGLEETMRELGKRRAALRGEVEAFSGAKGADLVLDEKEKLRLRVNELTDNLYSLESFFKECCQNDPEKMAAMRQAFGLEDEIEYIEA